MDDKIEKCLKIVKELSETLEITHSVAHIETLHMNNRNTRAIRVAVLQTALKLIKRSLDQLVELTLSLSEETEQEENNVSYHNPY